MPADRVQRRLAAILAADVVGYSRLITIDEEGTLARLKRRLRDIVSPLVATHRGRVFKVMGDGLLVVFGSAVDAVKCAIQVQAAMDAANSSEQSDCAIRLRIGINMGDVVVDGGDLYGDGVNIAARLESLAEAGGI
ncbi:MAG: adenylate/guanylate cyclase domain-containing protein, partial [Pseudaminobacter sp.]|nr:adenylate/guanylate cyclase domain-containing protein [Pseudaminobacter sp.]